MTDGNAVNDDSFISWKGEICRKGIHLLSLTMPMGFFLFSSEIVIICLLIAFTFAGMFDLLRLFGNEKIKRFLAKYFGFIMRPREKKSFSGATTILLAGILVYLLFDIPVAAASMVIIVIGDTAAALFGRRFGSIRFHNKSPQGTLAFIAASAIVVSFVPDLKYTIALGGVLVGALFEFLPLYIDDNLTVPLASGCLMHFLLA
ncbi:MAG: hypothetical protein J7K40_11265 [candidate division Zixibacteria bacterium]|nr:hypothetical protein [candidate division Zixibacteria bacterium]